MKIENMENVYVIHAQLVFRHVTCNEKLNALDQEEKLLMDEKYVFGAYKFQRKRNFALRVGRYL